jgi:hypothetical protein
LSPSTFLAQNGFFRPVSYYAFFKGWLLPSPPTGCYGHETSFKSLSYHLGTLTCDWGCFPFD